MSLAHISRKIAPFKCVRGKTHPDLPTLSLRIDNSCRGAVHVLWNFSRTKIATTSCDRSNKRAYFSACVDANGILISLE